MRKFLLLVFVFAMAMTAQAQDVLITKDGDALKVYGLELSATSVFYREGSGEDSPLVQKKKSDILMIKYSDGRREIFDEKGATSNGQQKEETASTEFTAEDKAANEAALKKWQSFPENKAKVKNKKAAYLCCVLRPNSDSRIADSNVELMFSGANMLLSWRNTINFVLSVRNKTNKTIYLDLGNTFFVKGEQSMAYYVPTANSSTSGTSTGVGVNMGAIAGAAGIGGAIGKAASGVNVSKGSSKYNTTITYSQRVIAIPPMSTKHLDAMEIRSANPKMPTSDFSGIPQQVNVGTPVNIGAAVDLAEGQVPITFGSFLTYSFTEDIQSPRTLQAQLGVRRVIGLPGGKDLGMSTGCANGKDLTQEQLSDVLFIIKQEK